jgi:hypothetical protein
LYLDNQNFSKRTRVSITFHSDPMEMEREDSHVFNRDVGVLCADFIGWHEMDSLRGVARFFSLSDSDLTRSHVFHPDMKFAELSWLETALSQLHETKQDEPFFRLYFCACLHGNENLQGFLRENEESWGSRKDFRQGEQLASVLRNEWSLEWKMDKQVYRVARMFAPETAKKVLCLQAVARVQRVAKRWGADNRNRFIDKFRPMLTTRPYSDSSQLLEYFMHALEGKELSRVIRFSTCFTLLTPQELTLILDEIMKHEITVGVSSDVPEEDSRAVFREMLRELCWNSL